MAAAWERRKLESGSDRNSLLDGLAASMPSLLVSYRMTQKAAGVGFDWGSPGEVLDKVKEEIGELEAAVATDRAKAREEIGDLLFAVANLARHLGVDPEAATAQTNLKFRRRFRHIEDRLRAQGRRVDQATLAEMDALWDEAKANEAAADPSRVESPLPNRGWASDYLRTESSFETIDSSFGKTVCAMIRCPSGVG